LSRQENVDVHCLQRSIFTIKMKNLFFILSLILSLNSFSQNSDMEQPQYALVIHGGAGTITRQNLLSEKEKKYHDVLQQALQLGNDMLAKGVSALDVVEAVVKFMEDSPLFNAGKGSVITADGSFELDASIMDGKTLKAGSVARVTNIKNPIAAARLVMEQTQHVMLVGDGAEKFAKQKKLELVKPDYFKTEERWNQYLKLKELQLKDKDGNPKSMGVAGDEKFGTVGAVALDKNGNLAAATSTGGMMNKMFGRIGDAPIIGAGTYADNRYAAVSCTGHGEYFIRGVAAYDVIAMMQYQNIPVEEAAQKVIFDKLLTMGGTGGIIAVDAKGNIAMPFSTEGMYRGFVKEGGEAQTFIFKE
jgi:L-asparaginase / beta-aspartyl-peptidase